MNTRKLRKALLTLCSALLLVSLSVGITLAYLTAETEVVQNTFTVGKVDITLDETKVDLYGKPVEPSETTQANTYKLMPGHEYTKDPTVHITKESEPSYVRMFVQITDIEDLLLVCDKTWDNFKPEDFVGGWDSNLWLSKNFDLDKENNVVVCEFWYKESVDARESEKTLPALFTSIIVPDAATNDEIAALSDMKINVIAQAIQADGFEATEDGKTAMENAWATWTAAPDFTNLPTTPDAGEEGGEDEENA